MRSIICQAWRTPFGDLARYHNVAASYKEFTTIWTKHQTTRNRSAITCNVHCYYFADHALANGTRTTPYKTSEDANSSRISFQAETGSSIIIQLHLLLQDVNISVKDWKARIQFVGMCSSSLCKDLNLMWPILYRALWLRCIFNFCACLWLCMRLRTCLSYATDVRVRRIPISRWSH